VDIQPRPFSQSPSTDLIEIELHPIFDDITHLTNLKLNGYNALDLSVGDAARMIECYLQNCTRKR